MKKTGLTVALCLLLLQFAHAQITSIAMDVADLKDAPFKLKGSRAMMVDRIDDASNKHIFVFSKVKAGSYPDTLYAQQFTKTGETWKLAQERTITFTGAISIWKNRKAFMDIDQDKKVDAFFIYSLHDAKMEKQLAVSLLLMYKNESYVVTDTVNKQRTFSTNFASLPESVKTAVLDYWEKLDKS